ncbi:MAG: hypothetical protein ABI181_07830 [Mycobacteriaceae bacterium]
MNLEVPVILVIIVTCEVAFWVAIALGLVARYPLHRPRLGLVVLASVPLIDLALLVATAMHLRAGATAGVEHGVAAIYIGFSLAYGHRLIAWADVRFAHRFADGPPPQQLFGADYARHCWGDVLRTSVAAVVAGGLTAGLVGWIGDPARTQELSQNYRWLALVWILDLLWASSTVLWPRRAPAPQELTVTSPRPT